MSAALLIEPRPRRAVPCITPARRVGLRRWTLVAVVIGVVLGGWQIQRLFLSDNFHAVIPGRIYRGGQPDAGMLEAMFKEHGIRTVINLRGCCNPFDWYLEEAAAAQRAGVAQEDICFSAGRLPSAHELARLVEVLDHAEYPVYLHCRRGSDRTGLGAAVALLLLENRTFAEARAQLSLSFGHFAIGRPAYLDAFLDLYEAHLKTSGQNHVPAVFRHWLANDYRGGWCSYEIERFELLSPPNPLPLSTGGEGTKNLKVREPIAFRVGFRNNGTETWQFRAAPTGGIHAGYLVHDEDGREVARGRGGFLDRDVRPGELIEVTLVIAPIDRPGRYRLLVDLIEEGHCWFYQTGTEPREEELIIRE